MLFEEQHLKVFQIVLYIIHKAALGAMQMKFVPNFKKLQENQPKYKNNLIRFAFKIYTVD